MSIVTELFNKWPFPDGMHFDIRISGLAQAFHQKQDKYMVNMWFHQNEPCLDVLIYSVITYRILLKKTSLVRKREKHE